MEDVTVEVKDNTGKIVAVNPVSLVKGETVASFNFTTALATTPTGVWTVNGVSIDLDAAAKLDKVNSVTTQLAFYNALNEAGVKNLKSANAAAYFADRVGFETLSDVQTYVNKINVEQAKLADTKAILTAIEKAKDNNNVIELLSALESFDSVNDKYVDAYISNATFTGIDPATDTLKDIQDAVYAENLIAAQALEGTALTSLDRKDYNAAVAALNFVEEDKEGITTKANLKKSLNQYNLVLKTAEAKTDAQLSTAYNNLVNLVNKKTVIGTAPFYDAARSEYIKAVKVEADKTPGTPLTASAIETAIVNGNKAAVHNVLLKIDGFTSATTNAKVLEALNELDSITTKAQFDGSKVKTDAVTLAKYKTDLVALATNATGWTGSAATPALANAYADAVIVYNVIDNVNNPSAISVMNDVDLLAKEASLTATQLWDGDATPIGGGKGMKDLPARFNAKEANVGAYVANKDLIDAAITDTTAVVADEAKLISLINSVNEVEALRAATTASEANKALSNLAYEAHVVAASEPTNYINLSSTQKLELAESLLEEALAGDVDTVVAAIFDANGTSPATAGFVFDYLELIVDVNAEGPDTPGTIAGAVTALSAIEYDTFDNLTPQRKSESYCG